MRSNNKDSLIYSGELGGVRITLPGEPSTEEIVEACFRLMIAMSYHPASVARMMIEVGEEQLTSFSSITQKCPSAKFKETK